MSDIEGPEEIQPQAQAALDAIRSHMANRLPVFSGTFEPLAAGR